MKKVIRTIKKKYTGLREQFYMGVLRGRFLEKLAFK